MSDQGPREHDPNVKVWESIYEAEAESLGFMLKRGKVRGSTWGSQPGFWLFSDEAPRALDGDGSAPSPLSYFTLGVLF